MRSKSLKTNEFSRIYDQNPSKIIQNLSYSDFNQNRTFNQNPIWSSDFHSDGFHRSKWLELCFKLTRVGFGVANPLCLLMTSQQARTSQAVVQPTLMMKNNVTGQERRDIR